MRVRVRGGVLDRPADLVLPLECSDERAQRLSRATRLSPLVLLFPLGEKMHCQVSQAISRNRCQQVDRFPILSWQKLPGGPNRGSQ